MRLAFGDCAYDSERRQLLRSGEPAHLTPKALNLLELLLDRRPRPVSKQEIKDVVWPETSVAEGSLANTVFEVRQALGDDPREPRFVRTVHSFGYAFCADASVVDEALQRPAPLLIPPAFRLVGPEADFALEEGENLIGRDSDCAVSIPSSTVSRHHARIVLSGGQAVLEDLKSKNGTFVGDDRITRPTPLQDGHRIRLGSIRLTFRVFGATSSTDSFRLTTKRG
jgi:DNA-binding winged helix-turn-helix (wHTH) protein